MPGPLALYAGSVGLNLASSIVGIAGERSRRKALVRRLKEAAEPLESRFRTARFGLSRGEGSLERTVTNRTLRNLASRGVLDSSIAAGEVAGAVAPIEASRQSRLDDLSVRVAAFREAIARAGDLPGFEEAFGGALGEAGDLLAIQGGRRSQIDFLEELDQKGILDKVTGRSPLEKAVLGQVNEQGVRQSTADMFAKPRRRRRRATTPGFHDPTEGEF